MAQKSLVPVVAAATIGIIAALLVVVTIYWQRNRESASPTANRTATTQRNRVDAGSFSIELPAGWKYTPQQGIDSQVGQFTGDGMTLSFDYGWYSNSLAEPDDSRYTVTFETVGGREAKIVVPRSAEGETTGIYFGNVDDGDDRLGGMVNSLQISGQNLTTAQQQKALPILRTVKFPSATNQNTNQPVANTNAGNTNTNAPTNQPLTAVLLNASTDVPITDARVRLTSDNGTRCIQAPCDTESRTWEGTTDANGTLLIPASMVDASMAIAVDGYRSADLRTEGNEVEGFWSLHLTPTQTNS